MSKQKYPEEFKIEAVKQITERGHKVAEVSARLGVSQHSLYQWIKRYTLPVEQRQQPRRSRTAWNSHFLRWGSVLAAQYWLIRPL